MVVAPIWCTGIVRYFMGYPTVHGPDAQARQNVIAFAVFGRYRPHQLERSYVPLVRVPIIESRDIKNANLWLCSELIILRSRRVKSLSTSNLRRRQLTINAKHIITWSNAAIVPSPNAVISIDFIIASRAFWHVFHSSDDLQPSTIQWFIENHFGLIELQSFSQSCQSPSAAMQRQSAPSTLCSYKHALSSCKQAPQPS